MSDLLNISISFCRFVLNNESFFEEEGPRWAVCDQLRVGDAKLFFMEMTVLRILGNRVNVTKSF